jgi:inner membrane protein
MTGKTHAGLGTAVGIALSSKMPGDLSLISIVVLVIASLLPDVDHPKSIFNKYILPIKNNMVKFIIYGSVGAGIIILNFRYERIAELNVIGILFIIIAFSSHRNGLTHSIAGIIIFAFVANYLGDKYNNKYLVYYFIIGYSSHIVGDMFTNRGVPLFYPLKNKNIKFPITFRVGSKKGNLIEDIISICSILYILYKLPMLLQLR